MTLSFGKMVFAMLTRAVRASSVSSPPTRLPSLTIRSSSHEKQKGSSVVESAPT